MKNKGDEYKKWGLSMNLEKTKYICIGEEKESLKFDRGRRNQTKYRMYLFKHKYRPEGR